MFGFIQFDRSESLSRFMILSTEKGVTRIMEELRNRLTDMTNRIGSNMVRL
jgi:hypothetical protein